MSTDWIERIEKDVVLTVRPEDLLISRTPQKGSVSGTVRAVLPAGPETTIHIQCGETILLAKEMGVGTYLPDSTVYIKANLEGINLYDRTSGLRLNKIPEQKAQDLNVYV